MDSCDNSNSNESNGRKAKHRISGSAGMRSSHIWGVRVWISTGEVFNLVFDDYAKARIFMNSMINRPNVEDAHLWEL